MKRNIAFWTRYTWEVAGVALALVVVFSLMLAVGTDGVQWSLLASMLPYLLAVVAMFVIVIVNTSSHILYIPLLIGMGETRRNVFLGYQFHRALTAVGTLVLCALIWLVIPGEVSRSGLKSLPTLAAALVLASSLGGILGTLYVKWKWLSVIVLTVFAMGGGFFGAFVGSGAVDILDEETIQITSLLERTPLWLVLAALGVLTADMILQWMLLRRREVRL